MMVKAQVYEVLDKLGIPFEKVDHPALFSQADNEKNPRNIDAVILKNLFLRNKKKSKYYLFTLPLEKKADLVLLRKTLEETNLSFGDETALEEKLNIKKGSVSLLNIIGVESTDVIFVIDREVLRYERIALHPNDNTASVIFSPEDIYKVLDYYDAKYDFVSLEAE